MEDAVWVKRIKRADLHGTFVVAGWGNSTKSSDLDAHQEKQEGKRKRRRGSQRAGLAAAWAL